MRTNQQVIQMSVIVLFIFSFTILNSNASLSTNQKNKLNQDEIQLYNYLSEQNARILGEDKFTILKQNSRDVKLVHKNLDLSQSENEEKDGIIDLDNELHEIQFDILQFAQEQKTEMQSKSTDSNKSLEKKKKHSSPQRKKNNNNNLFKNGFLEQRKKNQKKIVIVELNNEQNNYYTVQLAVGDRSQKFIFVVSTGMQFTFLTSKECTAKYCSNKKKFDYTIGNGNTNRKQRTEIESEIPSVEGYVLKDTFFIGSLVIRKVPLVEITKWDSHQFANGRYDGILGLGKTWGYSSIASKLSQDRKVRQPILQLFFTRIYSDNRGFRGDRNPSQLVIGGYKSELLDEEPKWYFVIREKYWVIEFEQILLDGKDTELCSAQKQCRMGFDSFQTAITGPAEQLKTILPKIKKLSGRNCIAYKELPVLTFVINQTHYNVYPQQYVITFGKKGLDPVYNHSNPGDIIDCQFAISEEYSSDDRFWTMGNIFTSRYSTIIKVDHMNGHQLGLAESYYLKHKRS